MSGRDRWGRIRKSLTTGRTRTRAPELWYGVLANWATAPPAWPLLCEGSPGLSGLAGPLEQPAEGAPRETAVITIPIEHDTKHRGMGMPTTPSTWLSAPVRAGWRRDIITPLYPFNHTLQLSYANSLSLLSNHWLFSFIVNKLAGHSCGPW